MHPGARIRARLATGLAHVMAAHSPLSAMLAAEAGFDAVWASGFELSALYGVPDASLVTMTQHVDMTRAIADRLPIPIVADLDTGFGNAVNVRHAVRIYERAGVGAVVLEDKQFPKSTSLLAGARHALVRTEEFQGKVAAATDARDSDELVIIARTEALIAGAGLAEALDRAHAYVAAGADLILVHSKQVDAREITAFAREWDGARPVVIVPTSYPALTTEQIMALGCVRMVIYGNHAVRACVAAMQKVFARIRLDGGLGGVHDMLVATEEIFRLQGVDRMQEIERRFLK